MLNLGDTEIDLHQLLRQTNYQPMEFSTGRLKHISLPQCSNKEARAAFETALTGVFSECLITCKSHASHMQVSCKSHASHMQVTCKYHASHMQVTCKSHASLMQVPCKSHASLMQVHVPCKSHASHMQVSCKYHASHMQVTCKYHASHMQVTCKYNVPCKSHASHNKEARAAFETALTGIFNQCLFSILAGCISIPRF